MPLADPSSEWISGVVLKWSILAKIGYEISLTVYRKALSRLRSGGARSGEKDGAVFMPPGANNDELEVGGFRPSFFFRQR